MAFRLRDNLYFCGLQDRIVFLDLDADRYFAISEAEADLVQILRGQRTQAQACLQERLVRRGFLVACDKIQPLPQRPVAAVRDYPVAGDRRARRRDVLVAVVAQSIAKWRLRHRPLVKLLGEIQAAGAAQEPCPPGWELRLARIVAAFEASALLLRSADRCLPRSLAIASVCRRARLTPSLVFGVRDHPFSAHCWVQLGDAVLTGDYEHVRLFSPIMAVP